MVHTESRVFRQQVLRRVREVQDKKRVRGKPIPCQKGAQSASDPACQLEREGFSSRTTSWNPISRHHDANHTQAALSKSQYQLMESLGETLAQVHGIGVSVGDSKPENFIASEGNCISWILNRQESERITCGISQSCFSIRLTIAQAQHRPAD